MTLQDHNTINKLISFYLKNTGDHPQWELPPSNKITEKQVDDLMMSNYLMGSKLDPNIY
jgi:hypothetical protein